MPLATAQQAIERVLSTDDGFQDATLELIGGEVLIHWDLVVDLVDWALANRLRWKKSFSFFIDTNGTLLDDAKKDWIRSRQPYVSMGLSLDGSPLAHDLNRSDSYSRIAPHLPFFAELWPQQTVKMTISPATVRHIFEGIVFIMSKGLRVAANFPLEDIWGSDEDRHALVLECKRQIEQLVEFFGTHRDLPLPSLINLPIHILFSAEERDRPWCGSGRSMLGVDVDGSWLACNRYARMSFDKRLFNTPISFTTTRCNTCFFRPCCQTCEANNWEATGNPNVRTSYHCEFIKLQVWGTAQVRALRLAKMISSLEESLVSLAGKGEEVAEKVSERLTLAAQELALVAEILTIFEKAENLEQAGADYYHADSAFTPPARPIWTLSPLGTSTAQ